MRKHSVMTRGGDALHVSLRAVELRFYQKEDSMNAARRQNIIISNERDE